MESVAEHINEMQKIYEEFGSVFDDITRSHAHKQLQTGNATTTGVDKKKLELNVGDLQVCNIQRISLRPRTVASGASPSLRT